MWFSGSVSPCPRRFLMLLELGLELSHQHLHCLMCRGCWAKSPTQSKDSVLQRRVGLFLLTQHLLFQCSLPSQDPRQTWPGRLLS